MRRLLTGLACCVVAWLACPAAAAQPPRIGLVLGGGGARGAAHIGVLEVLERLRVPVHCVAGTSMGALVAGAWAAGVSPERMRGELAVVDWNDLFQDDPGYRELNLRHKHIQQRFLPNELGITASGLAAPPGVVAGQKVKLFFNQLVRADLGEPDIARLALPLAIVATDIGNGDRVVFRSGSLTQAMRASMAVPGLLAPADVDGRRLVDGGLVDNLPVDEVRRLCQPDVVIAVNVGTPLLPAEQVGSLLSISAQMIGILTEQNVSRSITLLGGRDIYLRPELQGISAADFERSAEAAERGRQAADAAAVQLQALSLPPAQYALWRQRFEKTSTPPPTVDGIDIVGLRRVHPSTIERHLRQPLGQPLDATRLGRDLVRIYGEGDFEGVDYRLVDQGGGHRLQVLPVEKRWGPDYLRTALALSTTSSQGASYSLRVAWHRTWANAWGGQALATAELGSTNGLAFEWHQPLSTPSRWFADARAGYRRQRMDVFVDDDRVAEYVIERVALHGALGLELGYLGHLRLGLHQSRWQPSLSTGLPVLDKRHASYAGAWASLDLDRTSHRFFPRDGWALRATLADNRSAHPELPRYLRGQIEGRMAWPFGAWVLASRLAWAGSPQGRLPAFDSASLGGFLNLSAYSDGQVAGDSLRYGHLRAERVIGTLPMGLRGDLRLGSAFELGRIGSPIVPTRYTGTLQSLTLYVGGETPLGPVYLGVSHSLGRAANAYLFIGTP